MILFPVNCTGQQKEAITKLFKLLSGHGAVRVGETTVLSKSIHLQDGQRPHEVCVVKDCDSGQVFYGKTLPGQVLHADVFHSPGCLNPGYVARAIMKALSGITFERKRNQIPRPHFTTWPQPCLPNDEPEPDTPYPDAKPLELLFSYMDIQTGLGGGRLDGSLSYGREESVREAHTTHVHLAMINTPEILASFFTLVNAVESAIEQAGLSLRKIESLRIIPGDNPVDIRDYVTSSDSLLREPPQAPREQSGNVPPFRKEALARKIAQEAGSANEAIATLEGLARGLRTAELSRLAANSGKTTLEFRQSLLRANLASFDGSKYILTNDGTYALSFLKEHKREIEAYLKRLLWSLPSKGFPKARTRPKGRQQPGSSRGRSLSLSKGKGDAPVEVAVIQTCIARAVRVQKDRESRGFAAEDLRFSYVRRREGSPIVLLIDASASMTGRRMFAAKELARHLVLASKNRVAVITFQDADAAIACPFTRKYSVLDSKLQSIQAMGLTPLARGMEVALKLASGCFRKPLVLLITDGLPTVPSKSFSPVDDALNVARELARARIRFGCIGLEPHEGFLTELAAAAKGTLYVANELDGPSLAAIARTEAVF